MDIIEKIRLKRKAKLLSAHEPESACHKCGRIEWRRDGDAWDCFSCGNVAYTEDGKWKQQWDAFTQASTRQ